MRRRDFIGTAAALIAFPYAVRNSTALTILTKDGRVLHPEGPVKQEGDTYCAVFEIKQAGLLTHARLKTAQAEFCDDIDVRPGDKVHLRYTIQRA